MTTKKSRSTPGYGADEMAEYLVKKLRPFGIEAEEIIAEDWGWYIPISGDLLSLAVCCGHQDGDDDEFLCFTDPATPFVRRLFKRIDATEELSRILAAMEEILSSDPGITDVRWTDVEK